MKRSKQLFGFLGWILICALAGFFAAQFDPSPWYEMLAKPAWTPPNFLFPIAWSVLYFLIATSAWIVWKMESTRFRQPWIKWFFVQLILNALWSWIFFGMHMIGTGLAEIFLLWVSILFTIMLFWSHKQLAGILLLPYLLWVSYASALNFAIWQLN